MFINKFEVLKLGIIFYLTIFYLTCSFLLSNPNKKVKDVDLYYPWWG